MMIQDDATQLKRPCQPAVFRAPSAPAAHRIADEVDTPDLTDVMITAECHARTWHPIGTEMELAALRHLGQFVTESPSLMLNQLTATLLVLTQADSALVMMEDPDSRFRDLEYLAVAGLMAEQEIRPAARQHPAKLALANMQPELFHRPERVFAGMRGAQPMCEEFLAIPWLLASGLRGVVALVSHTPGKVFTSEDIRIVTELAHFARLAVDRSDLQSRKEQAQQEVSAERLADHLAHLINNPLQALINSLHLAPCTSSGMDYVQQAREQAMRLSAVVQSVLDIRKGNQRILTANLNCIHGDRRVG